MMVGASLPYIALKGLIPIEELKEELNQNSAQPNHFTHCFGLPFTKHLK
jgi:hypothetical protein